MDLIGEQPHAVVLSKALARGKSLHTEMAEVESHGGHPLLQWTQEDQLSKAS